MTDLWLTRLLLLGCMVNNPPSPDSLRLVAYEVKISRGHASTNYVVTFISASWAPWRITKGWERWHDIPRLKQTPFAPRGHDRSADRSGYSRSQRIVFGCDFCCLRPRTRFGNMVIAESYPLSGVRVVVLIHDLLVHLCRLPFLRFRGLWSSTK